MDIVFRTIILIGNVFLFKIPKIIITNAKWVLQNNYKRITFTYQTDATMLHVVVATFNLFVAGVYLNV